MASLKEIVSKKDNNYSNIEEKFNEKGYDLLSQYFESAPFNVKEFISVILPCHNVLWSLKKTLKALEEQSYKNFEVIVVDDGSTEDLSLVIKEVKCSYNLHYVKNSCNRDRPFARNTGISIAKGRTIVIMDPDMVPNKHYLLNMAVRQALTEKCVFVAFKEHIEPNDERISDENIKMGNINPDYQKDWRWFREYDSSITPPNFLGIKEEKSRKLWIIKESNYFKDFGKNKIICAWDLPSLVVGHGICFKKEDAIKSGGFAEEFIGWGHDDIAFGIRIIASGCYIIPCISSVAYHINHLPHSGSFEKKLEEFRINLKRYIDYVNTDTSDISFKNKNVSLVFRKANKYFYQGP